MNASPTRSLVRTILAGLIALGSSVHGASPAEEKPREIPEPLETWKDWAVWSDGDRDCPSPYSDAKKHLCFWPSRMILEAGKTGAHLDLAVTVFHAGWAPLPGSAEIWPLEVKANGAPVAVVEHEGVPAVRLAAGQYRLEGTYRWNDVPQRMLVPRQIGILSLTLDGAPVEAPVWDAQGFLWLKGGGSAEEADKNFLAVKVYASLEDGIPLWLRTEVELTVSGKSREEELGTVLPEGWKLASIESQIPVAIDDAGRMKAQVRAGKWTLHADSFRFDDPKEIRWAKGAKPAVPEELVAFRSRPDFRVVEIVGAPTIDVSQTTFPQQWRALPVYRWDTASAFGIVERMRGMGQQKPEGLKIARELWLDENGRGLTFRDQITGAMQQIWRLDATPGQDLGSVRSGGQGRLLTRNPQSGAPGVEIRTRELTLEATGRMERAAAWPATGWRSDADTLTVTLNLPPGWRLFAVFGADWVAGDWLTAWTLLDLFVLLVFSLAVFRLWGLRAALLAFVAFGLSFHEPGAPRYLWLVLLVPLALERVTPEGRLGRALGFAKWIAVAAFVLALAPFVSRQVQQALYPQLEIVGRRGVSEPFGGEAQPSVEAAEDFASNATAAEPQPPTPPPSDEAEKRAPGRDEDTESLGLLGSVSTRRRSLARENLNYDVHARIQTGPGVPEWKWREVRFGWNGPVSASQQVRPVLVPLGLERVLTVLRVTLLLTLAALLLGSRKFDRLSFRFGWKAAATLAFTFVLAVGASAQSPIPDQATLDKLRERLLEVPDAYPTAADIPSVSLALNDRRIVLDAEIHTAVRTAVPLPGKLPAWSPITVLVDDKPEVALRRDDSYLWLVLDAGVHRAHVEGSLANVTEWEWTFLLAPRQVKIDAPGWTFSGVKPDGVPEAQIFFSLKEKAAAGAASYDRQDLQTIAVVDRNLELGLVWQVSTTVTRLSRPGKALSLRVPLLPGENVLSANGVVKEGFIEVRLGAQEESFTWESGLAPAGTLELATRPDDAWVERWRLVASPVWDVTLSGLAPTFEPGKPDLVPLWQPWPGESVKLALTRPEAVAGATVTVNRATHELTLGRRQRVSKLALSLRSSLGEDFLVELPVQAEITSLERDGKAIPVRKDGLKLVVPLHPGEQTVTVGWKVDSALEFHVEGEEVRLPVESANVHTLIGVPEDRWMLWAAGPRRGPAVRFWGILLCSLLAAFALGRIPRSPIGTVAWMLLVVGLTQVPLSAALVVVAWLFACEWRSRAAFQRLGNRSFNVLQVGLAALTAGALCILLAAVGEGLLGNPEMFILGNGSSRTALRWFQARSENVLPRPDCFSVSIWWYRLLMLAWALWLASSLLVWLRSAWQSFGSGGFFRKKSRLVVAPPPLHGP